MFKKIFLALIAAALLTVSFSGTVLAADADQEELIKVRGDVIAVEPGAGKFRIEKNDGEVITFFVDENTTYRGLESLAEMKVGWKAGVAAREEGNKLWVVLVIAGEKLDLQRARGKVVDVNTSAGKFSIQTPSGEELRFFVDEDTRYGGQISSLEDLEDGMGAGVIYKEHSEGKWIAVGLIAGRAPNLVKVRGEVTAVDTVNMKFEILTAEGERMRFFVDENTRYQGQLSSLDEMQVGWQAGVAARDENGQLTAVLVIAGIRPEQIRTQGLVVGVDLEAEKFRLETPDGSVLTFFVNERTRYAGQVAGIGDLEEGMRAGVIGYLDQEGNHFARGVLAGNPRDENREIVKARGTIKTVNPGAEKFQLETNDGRLITVYVDDQTRYRGQITSFEDIEKDMKAGFAGYVDAEGNLVARLVIAGYPTNDRQVGEGSAPSQDTPRGDRPISPEA
jgi:hypothetical protein